VTVNPCILTSLEAPVAKTKDVEYIISMKRKTIKFPEFKQEPNCGYSLKYELLNAVTQQLLQQSEGIEIFTDPSGTLKIGIQTDDRSNAGVKQVSVVAKSGDFKNQTPWTISISFISLPPLPNNAPKFLSVPANSIFVFTIGKTERLDLPTILDLDGDKVSVEVDLMLARTLFAFKAETL
jgi:hypothetical protein